MLTAQQIDEIRDRYPVAEVAAKWVRLRRHGKGYVGPCPICSSDRGKKSATKFQVFSDNRWACAVCADGGDVIRLVQLVEGKTFPEAIDWLGGAPVVDAATRAAADDAREQKRAARERQAAEYRESERRRLWNYLCKAAPIGGTPAERYLVKRLGRLPRAGLGRLRCWLDAPYYADGGEGHTILHRGPAMLAPIIGPSGRFTGLHFTFIDLATPKGKVLIPDPEEPGEFLNAKKFRGSVAGGHIELVSIKEPRRLVIGEGIEKTLAVLINLEARAIDIADTAFWTSLDLGNMGGRAVDSVPHPSDKDARGRTRRVPSPEPDLSAPAIVIPDSVVELVLLGDSTSDRFLTETTLERAAARYARRGRKVRFVWSPAGKDFDDVLQVENARD